MRYADLLARHDSSHDLSCPNRFNYPRHMSDCHLLASDLYLNRFFLIRMVSRFSVFSPFAVTLHAYRVHRGKTSFKARIRLSYFGRMAEVVADPPMLAQVAAMLESRGFIPIPASFLDAGYSGTYVPLLGKTWRHRYFRPFPRELRRPRPAAEKTALPDRE
jgi:hypothetical protein